MTENADEPGSGVDNLGAWDLMQVVLSALAECYDLTTEPAP